MFAEDHAGLLPEDCFSSVPSLQMLLKTVTADPECFCRTFLKSPTALPLIIRQLSYRDTSAMAMGVLSQLLHWASMTANKLPTRLLKRALDSDTLDSYINNVGSTTVGSGADSDTKMLVAAAVENGSFGYLGHLVLTGLKRGVMTKEGVKRLLWNDMLWPLLRQFKAEGAGGGGPGGWGC